jgi:hypothetical protein
VTYVSWGDAARFANWLNNGQPTGSEGAGTTETGAYTLNGATTNSALMSITRNPGATWFIPNESEWYKAAYYQPASQGGDSDGYWTYQMQTNSLPYSDQPPGATPDDTRVGNFFLNDDTVNGYNDGFAVTGSTTLTSTQNYLTDVGAYVSSPSYYATYDQAGSLYEWNESVVQRERGIRGGSWQYGNLSASNRYSNPPEDNFINAFGFRVATLAVPIPGDYNNDGVIDAKDYVVLRKGNHPPEDYTDWRAHFGNTAGSGASIENASVPEPSSLALIMVALMLGAIVYAVR